MWLENKAQLQLQVKHRALRAVVVILLCNTVLFMTNLKRHQLRLSLSPTLTLTFLKYWTSLIKKSEKFDNSRLISVLIRKFNVFDGKK